MLAPPSFLCLALLLTSSSYVGAASSTGPIVKLEYGSFQGNATSDLVKFLGIPFAAPPYASHSIFACDSDHIDKYPFVLKSVGKLRFADPEPPLTISGVRQATSFGAACPQQALNLSSIPGLSSLGTAPPVISEDCRTATYIFSFMYSKNIQAFLSMSLNQPTFPRERNFRCLS